MAQLYHWPMPCTICESPVDHHCNTCGDALCSECRDNHMKSNAGRNHDIVPYTQRTKPSKPAFHCEDHPRQRCGVWCQTCNRGICGDCVTSPSHRGHHFVKCNEKIGERRKDIEREFDRCSKILSDWQASLKEAEKMKESYEKDLKHLDKEIVDRADEICEQVRAVERQSRKQLQEVKDASLRLLQDHQKTLTHGIQRLKEKVKEIENTLRSRDSSTILQCSTVEENIPGTKPSIDVLLSVPVFAPGSLNMQVLQKMFGGLSEVRVISFKAMPTESEEVSLLIANPSVESVIDIKNDQYAPVIACVESGQAWVQTGDRRLKLMDRKGKVKRTVKIDFDIYDLAVTPKGNILLPDYPTKRIRSMSMEGKIKTLFNTQRGPHGICCLPSGDIVVAFMNNKKVIQYSSDGIKMEDFSSLLFGYPWYVAHSKVNQQFFICDKSEPDYLGASGRILAFNMKGTLRYTYTGSDTASLSPVDVCTDMAGHVLITDYNKHRVHILNKAGNCIKYILTAEEGLTTPWTIDVDNDGYAWIGECGTGEVKVVKYRSELERL